MVTKTENQIWAFLIKQINQFLIDRGYRTVDASGNYKSGWQVSRNYQPTIQGLVDEMIYLTKVSRRRYGTQGLVQEKDENGDWQAVDDWIEEHLIQISAFKTRNPAQETADTITSTDIICELQAFINSALKVEEWKRAGYEVIKSTDIRELDYETDSGLNEKLPQFDFLLVVSQKIFNKIQKISKIDITTKRI